MERNKRLFTFKNGSLLSGEGDSDQSKKLPGSKMESFGFLLGGVLLVQNFVNALFGFDVTERSINENII